MTDLHNTEFELKEYQSKYRIIYILIITIASIFTMRLWYLQVIKGQELRFASEENRIKENKIPAPRGLILDRDGKILVENIPGLEAVISPQYTEDLKNTANAVSKIIDIPSQTIINIVKKSQIQNGPFFPVRIKENLTRDQAFQLKYLCLEHPGLDVREVILRHYVLNENGAQLFGYVGEISKKEIPVFNSKYKNFRTNTLEPIEFKQGDLIGKSGLEQVLEPYIRGIDGVNYIQLDAHRRETTTQISSLYRQLFEDKEAIPGHNVTLTIDRDVQLAAYDSFKKNDRIGALVALNNQGEVLAWLSTPSFNPNEFAAGISGDLWSKLINDPFKPLRNKVIQDHSSPGSSFKPYMALASLQEGVVTPSTILHCPGQFRFGRRIYHDHLKGGHGSITILEALERSSNVFFYRMGIALGIDRMSAYVKLFGLGSKTGIELENEVSGLMPSAEWKVENIGEEWQPGENLSTAIGQGFVLVTPLQMAVGYLAIGLEGKVYRPFVVKKIQSSDNNFKLETEPFLVRDVSVAEPGRVSIDKKTFKTVKEGMWRVCNGNAGTARWWKVPGVEMAGKTGTSQVMSFSADEIYDKCEAKPFQQRHHGWFIAFAPAENPEIAVAVLAEHSCHGSTGAAPIVRDVIKAYMEKHYPDKFKKIKGKDIDQTKTGETYE